MQGFSLHHPQGVHGYRISRGYKSIVFATDHEHGGPAIDAGLRHISRNADVLIYDAQYTPAEYAQRKGWGHSTWQEAVNVAQDARSANSFSSITTLTTMTMLLTPSSTTRSGTFLIRPLPANPPWFEVFVPSLNQPVSIPCSNTATP